MSDIWAKNFYNSRAWRALREQLIITADFLCAECGTSYLKDSTQLVGHHIKELTPANINDVNIALNPANIKIICRKCHNKIHQRFEFSNEHKIFLVYGAPCSGKSTFVNQLSRRGDLIVDLDAIYFAISGCEYHDNPNNLKRAAFAVRDALIEQIRLRAGDWNDAYVVGGYPRKLQREALASKLGAELVYIDSTLAQAKVAATATRGNLAAQWHEYIERWFQEFEP